MRTGSWTGSAANRYYTVCDRLIDKVHRLKKQYPKDIANLNEVEGVLIQYKMLVVDMAALSPEVITNQEKIFNRIDKVLDNI